MTEWTNVHDRTVELAALDVLGELGVHLQEVEDGSHKTSEDGAVSMHRHGRTNTVRIDDADTGTGIIVMDSGVNLSIMVTPTRAKHDPEWLIELLDQGCASVLRPSSPVIELFDPEPQQRQAS